MTMQAPPDQSSYWNKNVDPTNLGREFDPGAYDYAAEEKFYLTPDQVYALEQFAPVAGKQILDVGAGIGMNSLWLARHGTRVIAIDLAQERLRMLRGLAAHVIGKDGDSADRGGVFAVRCSAEELPFRRDVFDHAYSKAVLIHTKLEQSSSEISRTLRPGGVAMLIEPLQRNPLVNLYRRTLAPQEWRTITQYFGERELATVRAPFAKHEERYYYLSAFLAFGWQFSVRVPLLFRGCLAVLNGLDNILMRVFPKSAGFAWFVAIRLEK